MIDFGALFSQLISTYWWLLPLFVLAALFKSPWFKGFIGEVVVNLSARLSINKNESAPLPLRRRQNWSHFATTSGIDERINLFIRRGMTMSDCGGGRHDLSNISFYRLTIYARDLRLVDVP